MCIHSKDRFEFGQIYNILLLIEVVVFWRNVISEVSVAASRKSGEVGILNWPMGEGKKDNTDQKVGIVVALGLSERAFFLFGLI